MLRTIFSPLLCLFYPILVTSLVWEGGLCLQTVLLRGRRVRANLDTLAHNMPLLLYFCLHISQHGNIDRAIGIIPIKADPAIKVACQVFGKSICFLLTQSNGRYSPG
jgi:hypothetical protein